ncbi:hypothetical protein D3C84_1136940 [compost metagenome]
MQTTDGRDRSHGSLGQPEGGAAAGDAQVALQCQLQSTAQAVTVDSGNQWLVQVKVGEVHQADVKTGIGSRLIGQEQRLGI